jgi:hypothetical protein
MIGRPAPYPLDQSVPRLQKEPRGNLYLISALRKRKNGRDQTMSRALHLAVVMLVTAFSIQTAVAQEHFLHALGHFETLSTTQGILIAAPHGTYDIRTDVLAKDVARTLGAGYVIAGGFASPSPRINVNRPSEGAGHTCEKERRTERARDVYDQYARLIDKIRDGKPLRLYVEIHGHTSIPFLNRLEIATTGITTEEARRLKDRFPAFLAQAKAAYPAYPDLELRIEPLDKIYFGARCNKTTGYLSTRNMERALHMEIPRPARTPEALKATAALVSSIVRATMTISESASGPGPKRATSDADKKSSGGPAR